MRRSLTVIDFMLYVFFELVGEGFFALLWKVAHAKDSQDTPEEQPSDSDESVTSQLAH